jgi:putative transposase
VNIITERPKVVSKVLVCRAIGVARHRLYPRAKAPTRGQLVDKPVVAKPHPRSLSTPEREAVLEQLHSPRFVDSSPRAIVASLQSEGTVLASVSSCYRILRNASETAPRVLQRAPYRYAVPRLQATGINQVWTWDITKLPTLVRGVYLCLYVILDLFSRHVVGWMLSCKENAGLAKHLFKQALVTHQIDDQRLIVHQDRGSPMIAHSFRDLVQSLGAELSYSRPRVSNDNAFVESHFRTAKYHPSYPGKFKEAEHARQWFREFLQDYERSPHSGLNDYAPNEVWTNRIDAICQVRQQALNEHYAKHPNRYVHGKPRAKKPPSVVCINPLDGEGVTARTALTTASFFKPSPPEVEINLPQVFIDKKFA